MNLTAYKSSGDIEAEVLMMSQVHTGSFLVVEGVDDIRFWTSRVADGACELVDGNGKPNVEGALTRLDSRSFSGVLGIVDDDCDGLDCRPLPSPNLIATDAHDLECVLLRSPALDRVLGEFGSRAKIRKFEQTQGVEVRNALVSRGIQLGRLRWLSRRAGWPYPFGDKGPARFVDQATWTVDTARLEADVVASGAYPSVADLRAALGNLPTDDPWSICQGHDLVAVLGIGLRKVLGNLKAGTGVDYIASLLRSAYDDIDLERGHLGVSIRAWEQANTPYRLLRRNPASVES
ncbi:DUF4435 domain-containing protein [Thiocystis violascens]|uniref:DUF4435 domain-containing protein n=1 Tax=Thiocystis violascens (strain ATCC 17096 / DSM 198 / 6111) TaxID=765911 RepID=I3Y9G3_THIV6|nr:DUF4435 domain-containing protein [Thiocystis violascens]AFL73631.1 hypothetical protein Thivi_1654 [Thiocystis violascens DSM 198]